MISPTSMMARSSLEEMLDSLRRKDECDKPKDLPPALPARPTSRARLPSARRSLPTNFKVEDGGHGGAFSECNGKEEGKRKETALGFKRGSFGSKKMRKEQNVESPYAVEAEESKYELMSGSASDRGSAVPCASPRKTRELDWDDNVGYFIKKVIEKGNNGFYFYC